MPTIQVNGSETVLRMDRCIRAGHDQRYERDFGELLKRETAVVTLDLSGLDRINPQTVRLILLFWERLWQSGRRLRLRGLQEQVYSVLHRLKVDRYIACQM